MPERAMEETAAAVKRPMRSPEPAPHAHMPAPGAAWDAAGARAPGAPSALLAVQRAAGNRAVMRMLDAQRPGHSLAGPSTAVQRVSEDELDDDEDVQRSAAALHEPSDEAIRSAAAEGVRTPATMLPHLDRIQASFGRHSVAHVQAHVGPEAARASRAMNALAYASGNHVVFGATPDLRTAAHEAAHIVQQQAGVQLSGGIGRAGDPYERQADAVADAVVAGRSAEGILEQSVSLNASHEQPRGSSPKMTTSIQLARVYRAYRVQEPDSKRMSAEGKTIKISGPPFNFSIGEPDHALYFKAKRDDLDVIIFDINEEFFNGEVLPRLGREKITLNDLEQPGIKLEVKDEDLVNNLAKASEHVSTTSRPEYESTVDVYSLDNVLDFYRRLKDIYGPAMINGELKKLIKNNLPKNEFQADVEDYSDQIGRVVEVLGRNAEGVLEDLKLAMWEFLNKNLGRYSGSQAPEDRGALDYVVRSLWVREGQ